MVELPRMNGDARCPTSAEGCSPSRSTWWRVGAGVELCPRLSLLVVVASLLPFSGTYSVGVVLRSFAAWQRVVNIFRSNIGSECVRLRLR